MSASESPSRPATDDAPPGDAPADDAPADNAPPGDAPADKAVAEDKPRANARAPSSPERMWTFSYASIAVLAGVIGIVGYVVWGMAALLLSLAGGALCLTIVLMWASLQQMGDTEEMSFEQALSYAAPTFAEEQKRALLRTLKDLEYELSVGKISREDYDEVSAEVREKAKRFIALSDDEMQERLVLAEQRLRDFERPPENKPKKRRKKAKPPENPKTKEAEVSASVEAAEVSASVEAVDSPSDEQPKGAQ